MSATPIPIADTLVEAISVQVSTWPSDWVLSGRDGAQLGSWLLQREMQEAREQIDDFPDDFR